MSSFLMLVPACRQRFHTNRHQTRESRFFEIFEVEHGVATGSYMSSGYMSKTYAKPVAVLSRSAGRQDSEPESPSHVWGSSRRGRLASVAFVTCIRRATLLYRSYGSPPSLESNSQRSASRSATRPCSCCHWRYRTLLPVLRDPATGDLVPCPAFALLLPRSVWRFES